MQKQGLAILVDIIAIVMLALVPNYSAGQQPKLVLQITVDQLRGDLHRHYLPKMGRVDFAIYWKTASYMRTRIMRMPTRRQLLVMRHWRLVLIRRLMVLSVMCGWIAILVI